MMRRAYLDLFLISFLILFFELASIRWFASTVVFLTFFTNIVLLASFLGVSVGLLTARRPQNFVRSVLPFTLAAVAAAVGSYLAYWGNSHGITVTVGDQRTSPGLLYFGTEYRPADPSQWLVPIWIVAGLFFALVAFTFIGLGQVMGRAFEAIRDRVLAYSIDVLGSLTGIAAFALMSYLELPPEAWYLPIVALVLYFSGWRNTTQLSAAAMTLVLIAIGSHGLIAQGRNIWWSPYYKVAYAPESGKITTNNIGHQEMHPVGERAIAYTLPHLLNRDAGGAPFGDVLIIGAGSGNDVAAALRSGARHIDAVEIDPRINRIGRMWHPDRPYSDPRVSVHLDDGRSYLRNTERKYDLVVYALVDSLVLHSGYSSLRLENFLFTTQAFADVKRVLKPDGVFAMYNFYRQGWVVGRLAEAAQQTFGSAPLVITLPYEPRIRAEDSQANHFTFVLASPDARRLAALRERFARGESFWVSAVPRENEARNSFSIAPPAQAISWRVAPAQVDLAGVGPIPSDDWPQLYLRAREIPWAPIGQGMLIIGVLSCAILLAFAPLGAAVPNGRMFFLGAGFMLLESKGVVHMALLFGSTWVVNSIVFFAILLMVLLANLYVLRFRPVRLAPYYALLLAALLVDAATPMSAFLSLQPLARTVSSCFVVFVPVFFAGVVFATAFSRSVRPDVDFGWNVAGIILGGLSEQLSLVLGFSHLLFVAIAFYAASLLLAPRPALARA
ncbi:MAG TPA: hypothetical protein VFI86_00540 [Burkholderiales bacterium]|nr:hypothetical protein [Burkholderiales bacterium]